MYSFEATRLVPADAAEVAAAIRWLVAATWPDRARVLEDDGLRRIDAINQEASSEPDVWITWQLEPQPEGTAVRVLLDELEPGPTPELDELLDRLAEQLTSAESGDGEAQLAVVRALYGAMASRDTAALFDLLDPSIVITQDAALPWGGAHRGHDGFATFAIALTQTIDSQVAIDALYIADGEVIQVGRTRGTVRANAASFDIPEVHRWKIRDGKAFAAHFAIDTEAMLDALARPAPSGDGRPGEPLDD
jgi:ketosteroid isomerase-like protein